MYAVLVIAAILLSVAPMHARTILAALPAGTPGHQFAPDQQANRAELPSTTRQTAPARAAFIPATRTSTPAAPAPSASPSITPPSLGLLEHAPNAP